MKWSTPAVVAALAVSLVACTDRPILDGYEGATEVGNTTALTVATSGPTSTASTTEVTTSTSGPTTGPTTSPTTGPSTVSTVTTTPPTTDPSGFDIGVGYCGDFWCSPVEDCNNCPEDCVCSLPAGLTGCPIEWGWAGMYGVTPFGEFNGFAAYFAWEGFGDTSWSTLNLFVFDSSEDIGKAIASGPYDYDHYSFRAYTGRNYPQWVSTDYSYGVVTQGGKGVDTSVTLEIDGKLGNWDAYDPNDPPRLYGYVFDPGDGDEVYLEGYFEAAFCEELISWVIPE